MNPKNDVTVAVVVPCADLHAALAFYTEDLGFRLDSIFPADDPTVVEHELALPTATERRDRRFGGQRFVRHEASSAEWRPWGPGGFEARDTGIGEATGGLAEVRVLRSRGATGASETRRHDGDLLFNFVLNGEGELRCEGREGERLAEGDCCVVPAGVEHRWSDCSAEMELLEVAFRAIG